MYPHRNAPNSLPGQLQDPVALGQVVQVRRRIDPGLRRILIAFESGVDEATVAQRREIGDREEADHRGQDGSDADGTQRDRAAGT